MPPAKPPRLTVSEVRQKIFEASQAPSEGVGSLAGQLFHRTAESALKDGHPASWKAVLTGDLNSAEWAAKLYDEALGPELTRLQSSLGESGAEVLAVWRGVQSFTRWFCGLLAEAIQAGSIHYDERKEEWIGADALFRTECELSATFKQPGWSDEVILTGRADHLIQISKNRWCVVEFKLGGGHPEADAAQACLYHELLGGQEGSAALISFGGDPEPQQTVLAGEWIREARPKLFALIGALAGVTHNKQAVPSTQLAWPKPASETEVEIGKRLIRTLQEFKADARLVAEPLVGPTFIRYLLEPARGVTASRIDRQGENLQLRLQLEREPIIGRAAGRIAIDVERPNREFVLFSDVRGKLDVSPDGSSRVLAGVDFGGKIHFVDLAKDAAHLLVGGVPGSGKSEWLRSAIASLLLSNTPNTLRLVLIDPKKNAFSELADSEYLWKPDSLVDSPEGQIIPLLEDVIDEMRRRNELLKQAQADNLAHYRRKTGNALPRIVCVVDEFAELLMSGKKAEREEIERSFARIAQLGRAPGVHLILATQRPSRQVVSGVLKANIAGRVALRVASRIESEVILDQGGAQHLLGHGDLLLMAGNYDPIRLQSPYLTEDDRRALFTRPSPS